MAEIRWGEPGSSRHSGIGRGIRAGFAGASGDGTAIGSYPHLRRGTIEIGFRGCGRERVDLVGQSLETGRERFSVNIDRLHHLDRRAWLKLGGLSLGSLVSGPGPGLARLFAAEA